MTDQSSGTLEERDGETAAAGGNDELRQLRRWTVLVIVLLAALIACSLVVVLALLDEARSTDLRRLAILSLLAGLIGGSALALIESVSAIARGWELSNGTKVLGRARSDLRWRQKAWEESGRGTGRDRAASDRPPGEEDIEGLFAWWMLPEILAAPLVGATLGFAVFAGAVGGFLLAAGEESPSYSAPGVLFLAFLAGFFARNFLSRLKASAEALFGEDEATRRAREIGRAEKETR